jgi:YesN/AraC family two-component response regulator
MAASTDMSTPVTRGELREELKQALAPLATKAEVAELAAKVEQLATKAEQLATKAEVAQLATKAEVAQLATKAEVAQLATKAEVAQLATKAEVAQLATKAEVAQLAAETKTEIGFWGGALMAHIESSERRLGRLIDGVEQRLGAELARHAEAIHESMSVRLVASEEKYADLPGRVGRLETAVFAPKQR